MKKNKKNHLLRVSFFISLFLHLIAIGYVNHMKIRSYLSTGNISFSNKTKIINKKKTSQEIMNLVLLQKQKDLQALIENKKIIILPQKEISKNITNDFHLKNEPSEKNNYIFNLPVLITHDKLNEKENNLSKNNIESGNTSPNFASTSPPDLASNSSSNSASDSSLSNYEITNPTKIEQIDASLLSYIESQLPEFKMETQNLSIPFCDIKKSEVDLCLKSKNDCVLPNKEKENAYSIELTKELCAKAQEIFKFKQLIDNDKSLIADLTKFKKKEMPLITQNFSLIDMPQLNELTTLPYKDYFDIEVTFSPQIEGKGYIFAITFVPKPTIKLNRLKQNIFFLVDKSNSIQKERLTNTRHAITSSLSFLNAEDTFNIFAFDTKLDALSAINLKNDNISVSRARSFLRNQNIGSFFSSTNFSIPLYKVLDKNIKNDEINIAILLSNGDGLNKIKNNRIISQWTQTNKGNLSLYTICLNNDKNLSVLELFSSLNKGKLLSADSTKGIKRKLQKLLKSISAPIAKDIVVNSICLDQKANIKLYPLTHQSPHLYIDEPYTVLGTIEKLQDFTIFLQGKCKNFNFNLKKHIKFDEAKQGGTALQKELAMKQASLCYEKYLADNNPLYLQEAKNHIKSFDIQPVFR